MMKYTLYVILFFVSVFCISSCASTDSDITPPVIGDIIINPNDTINIGLDDTIKVNVGDVAVDIDTLILGHRLLFSADFSDNEKLSSYFIYLDSVPNSVSQTPVQDTIFFIKRAWTEIYGMKEYSFQDGANNEIYIPESISYQGLKPGTEDYVTLKRPLREGLCDLHVFLLDVAGNQTKKTKKIMMLNRKTVIGIKKKAIN